MKKRKALTVLTTAVLMLVQGIPLPSVQAASHREAPLIANDPTADITDVYSFRSWEDPGKVVFIMNVIPGQEPGSGPNYFNFSDDVLYTIHIDVNGDGDADDVKYEFRFATEVRGVVDSLGLPVAYAAVPPITALDGPGSEGLGLRQSYTVKKVTSGGTTDLGTTTMFAVPSNVGPRTMPDYEALAAKGIFSLHNGGRVFAGQRDETFYIDLGATFDTLNFRRQPPILTAAQDARDNTNPTAMDAFSGFNVNTIALEVPIADLGVAAGAVIGMYASTSRMGTGGGFQQVSRMGNPLVNELIISTGQKDAWNATDPKDEAAFKEFYLNPRLAAVINLVFGTSFPTTGRTDLLNALLKYPSQPQNGDCTSGSPCSELLRLNLGVSPTQPANQERLTILAGDNAGWPNGRRPNDDVTDIALRVVAGALFGPVPALGDGVNFNINAPGAGVTDGPGYGSLGNHLDTTKNGIAIEFPYLPTPHDGRNRRHIDCNEAKGQRCR